MTGPSAIGRVLAVVLERGPVTAKDVQAAAYLSPSGAKGNLRKLVAAGAIEVTAAKRKSSRSGYMEYTYWPPGKAPKSAAPPANQPKPLQIVPASMLNLPSRVHRLDDHPGARAKSMGDGQGSRSSYAWLQRQTA